MGVRIPAGTEPEEVEESVVGRQYTVRDMHLLH
jgi:hypothetical protein